MKSCKKQGLRPESKFSLKKLRVILSTGAPLYPEDFDWVYNEVKKDIQLSSLSGGTDIISCFFLGNPILPVIRGEIQCLGLGMDVAAFDVNGQALQCTRKESLYAESLFRQCLFFSGMIKIFRVTKTHISNIIKMCGPMGIISP